MITRFNRKEICVTFDMKEQARVRDVLAGNGIDLEINVWRVSKWNWKD